MSNPTHEDAKLILQLYEMRREDVMRNARNFFSFSFFPETAEDVQDVLMNRDCPEHGAYIRQVTSYWEMVAALVNHGTLHEQLFFDCNGEYLVVWAKIGHLVTELRGLFGPNYLTQLEQLVKRTPDGEARAAMFRERLKAFVPR